MLIENKYPIELSILKDLFGRNEVERNIMRLNLIFEISEKYWFENLDRIQKKKVNYLLIAEAPPWSETGVWGRGCVVAFLEM